MTNRRPPRARRTVAVAAALAAALGAARAGVAEDATTRPAAGPLAAASLAVRLRDLLPPEPPAGRQEPPTDQEWAAVADFAKENLPNRWAFFEKVEQARGAGSPLVQQVKARIAGRYRGIMRTATQSQNFRDRLIGQARLEDRAWGAAVDARRNPDAAGRAKVREAVAELVRDVIDTRAERLNRLRQLVAAEQDRLQEDVANTAALIDASVGRLLGDGNADDDRPRRRGPGGGRGPATAPAGGSR